MILPAIIIGAAVIAVIIVIADLEGFLRRFDEWREGDQ